MIELKPDKIITTIKNKKTGEIYEKLFKIRQLWQ
jgi:hypothetical protein